MATNIFLQQLLSCKLCLRASRLKCPIVVFRKHVIQGKEMSFRYKGGFKASRLVLSLYFHPDINLYILLKFKPISGQESVKGRKPGKVVVNHACAPELPAAL